MLNAIRPALDPRDPQGRVLYADLVERLRCQAPDLYRQSIQYYHENLITDAVADGRWEAIPDRSNMPWGLRRVCRRMCYSTRGQVFWFQLSH